jgi:hypothetical protein
MFSHARCIARPDIDLHRLDLSMDTEPVAGPALSISAELQQIFYWCGAKIRRTARNLARHRAYLPLPSLEPRRIRPALRRL